MAQTGEHSRGTQTDNGPTTYIFFVCGDPLVGKLDPAQGGLLNQLRATELLNVAVEMWGMTSVEPCRPTKKILLSS